MQNKSIRIAASLAICLAFFVVMLGAYTRLSDAGLGCPDWPGCYGRMVLPSAAADLTAAQNKYPTIPIESRKAWTEMAHRYAAGTLGLLIFFIAASVLRQRMKGTLLPWHLPLILFFLLLFQAALGMWTVTLKLLPVVVMGHLLGGMLIVASLSRFRLQISSIHGEDRPSWRPWARLALLIVFMQIALGGWVSSNYAGISCLGFPQCNGTWLPPLHFAKGFNLFSSLSVNYQGGLLDNEVRITIQFVHRLGALVTALYLLIFSILMILKSHSRQLKIAAMMTLILVFAQCTLGVMNVLYLLPINIAVAHNGIAALLLAHVFCMLHLMKRGSAHA